MYSISVSLLPLLDSSQCYFMYTGLLELAEAGEVEARWEAGWDVFDYTVVAEIERASDGERRRVCFDIHDRGYCFSERELRASDVYYKRSYDAGEVAKLEPEHRRKVAPFGPIFGPGNRSGNARLVAGWLAYAGRRPRKAKESLWHLRDYLRLPVTGDFERGPGEGLPRRVLFQTRLWTEAEVTGAPYAPEINEERAGVARALRKELGDRFVGGALPTPYAREHYPDLVCEWDTRRSAYLKTIKECRIGVYTKGLHNATAWKLGEYAAASLCIVSSGFHYAFPEPFTEPLNYLGFKTPEECVAHCARLLENDEEARAMGSANFDYYRRVIHPATQMRRLIEQAFARTGGGGLLDEARLTAEKYAGAC